MAKQYKDTLKQLGDRLKSEPVQTPIQEVRLVEPAPSPTPVVNTSAEKKGESHVNFWVPDEMMERLKLHAVKSKKKIKQIGYEALDDYLPKLD